MKRKTGFVALLTLAILLLMSNIIWTSHADNLPVEGGPSRIKGIPNPAIASSLRALAPALRQDKGGNELAAVGLPNVLNSKSALSAAVMTTVGGRGTQFSDIALLANNDGREDYTADRAQKVDDFSFVEADIDFTLTRTAISEHTFANGFNENGYYYADSVGNLWVAVDANPGPGSGTASIDTLRQVNLPQLVNTGATGGITLVAPGGAAVGGTAVSNDCLDDQVVVTGIAVNPVADLGDFGAASCGTTGEVVYVSVLDNGGCTANAANQPLRTRIFAFAFTDGVGAGALTPVAAIQIFRTRFSNSGIAVDDDGSLYYALVDNTQFTGGTIFKSTELPRTVAACPSPRINRVIPSIPAPPTLNSWVGTAANPVVIAGGSRHTNYGGGASGTFGNVVSIAAGTNNVIYAAVARSLVSTDDPGTQNTEGSFASPSALGVTPSMIISLADTSGAFDVCSGETGVALPNVGGTLPVADGIADTATFGQTRNAGVNNFRIFVLGNGPDIRGTAAGNTIGALASTLKLDMQIDPTIYSGLTVDEEGTAYVVSGGTPAGVGVDPSPRFSEILALPDYCPADRRADFIDLRGDALPNPPASGGNVGDGDSDRFDHLYWQAPIDGVTNAPTGAAGLARGFLRYTNRLAPNPLAAGVTLGVTQPVLGDDDTTLAAIPFENLDPGHQVAGGDDQNTPFRGDDDDGLGGPLLVAPLEGGFEFLFGGPVGTASCVWNAFFLNSNGNITFGAGDTDNTPAITDFRAGLPKIAPAWTDLNPNARAASLSSFPMQALGFASDNAFKVRWINVPQFGAEGCSTNASNTFSITLSDDGTGIDENASQVLDPADPTGDNVDPAFDLQEGPTDLHFVREPNTQFLVPEPPRGQGTGNFVNQYGRIDLLGTDVQPIIAGYSIGGLDPLNPPGLCEENLGQAAGAADTGTFGVLPGNQTASIAACLIGEGTEPTLYEFFNEGTVATIGAGGEVTLATPDFDLRFEGNDPAFSTSTRQRDLSKGTVGFFGISCSPPPNPQVVTIIADPFATTPTTTGLINSYAPVQLNLVGTGFFKNEVTTICQGFGGSGVPERPGKTVTTAVTFSVDTNGDGIPEGVVALGSVTPINRNLVRGTLVPLALAPGTAFPFAEGGGAGTATVTTTFTSGDNNVFGPFTRTGVGSINTGTRAPVVLAVTPSDGNCSIGQDVLISGSNFQTAISNVTRVFAVELGNPANEINATSFVVLNPNLITAHFNFTGANAGKVFLIFVTGTGGTSRNAVTLPVGAPPDAPTGNEQGLLVKFGCDVVPPLIVPDTLEFGSANLDVTEETTTVNVTVNRLNPSAGTVTVDYATGDGSATQKGDYEIALGTITFGPGETTKTIPVLINEDSYLEGAESFSLNLSNPTAGGVTGAPSTITILDDDLVPPTTNPLDNASDFVRQNYHDFLNRDADAAGLAFWVGEINSCAGNAACIDIKRQNVSAAFFLSIEFQETGGNVIRTQRVAFGKKSNEAATRTPYTQFMRDAQQVGRGVVVGQAGADALLEANKQAYAEQIVNSAAFITRFPLALNAADYVDALFTSAGVVPTTAERNAAIAAFGAGGTAGRVAALRSAADANSVRQAELNSSFVLLQYYGYLRRNPTDAPDANDDGYQFWLTKLNSFGGNFVQAEMVKGFLVSGEYRQRFGP